MQDSDGNKISIGDRVKVLWNFDNKIHIGKIIRIRDNLITIHSMDFPKMTTSDHSRITKLPEGNFNK